MSKAILVIDISDEMLEKHNESIEDLRISYSINGRVENYVETKCRHLLKPLGKRLADYGLEVWSSRVGPILQEKGLFNKIYEDKDNE